MPLSVAIIHYASPPAIGGVEFVMEAQARYLLSRNFKVKIITGRGKKFAPKLELSVIPEIYSLHERNLKAQEELKKGETETFQSLKKYILKKLTRELKGYDLAIAHNFFNMPFNMALTSACHELARENKTKFIVWFHDSPYFDDKYREFLDVIDDRMHPWNLLKTPCEKASYVTITEARKKNISKLLNIPSDKIKVVPNGIDISRLLNLPEDFERIIEYYSLWDKGWLGLLPTRLIRRKNIEFAIKIIADMNRQGRKSALIITGPPDPHQEGQDYFNHLKNLIKENNVEDKIIFLTELPNPSGSFHVDFNLLKAFYLTSDFLILPSFQEGFGIPVLEAGLFRTPVFCSNIPTLREVGGEDAYFFSLDDSPEEIATMIIQTLEKLSPLKLFHRILRTYNWEKILDTYLLPFLKHKNQNKD
jgi:glycosyltransferase involved in cell wall biosynthesis